VPLRDHLLNLGPYTIITVDEGYAAVTQNNGKQMVMPGGHTHLLDHMNWKFEKFMTLKIQTDDLEKIKATSADNIDMMVTSTVNWRIFDPVVAATLAAETMAKTGKVGDVSADITKLRKDILKQAVASLAAFIGSVNYSESFHVTAAAQAKTAGGGQQGMEEPVPLNTSRPGKTFTDNPLYNTEKMNSAVEHANRVTKTYGVEVMSINIISATPCDDALTRSLASGAVASAMALQAETQARGNANAMRISAEAEAQRLTIAARGVADSQIIGAEAIGRSLVIKADSDKAADVLHGEGEAQRTLLHAKATSDGLQAISNVVSKPGGKQAMVQRLAEQYVTELPEMAKSAKMMIVPDKPTDVSGVVATALGMTTVMSNHF
jgi:regulator of protease activity HflC (stomatin/prohibitin superfamily)